MLNELGSFSILPTLYKVLDNFENSLNYMMHLRKWVAVDGVQHTMDYGNQLTCWIVRYVFVLLVL